MGQFTAKKAPGRDSVAKLTNAKLDLQSDAKTSGAASNQEQLTDRGTKKVTPSTASSDSHRYTGVERRVGHLVQMAQNEKGTSTLKDPLNAYRSKTFPAVENPDPIKDRSAKVKAPARRAPNTGPKTN